MVSRYNNLLLTGENGLLMVVKNVVPKSRFMFWEVYFTAKRLGYLFWSYFLLAFYH